MRAIAFFVLALVAAPWAPAFARAHGDRDAEVYAAVLAAASGGASPPPAIVVRDRTATVEEMVPGSRSPAADLRQRMPEASEPLVEELVAKAKAPHTLTPAQFARVSNVKARLVPDAEIAHAFDGVPMAEAWRRLAGRYGGARSVVRLSPVAYDDATHTALVYLGVTCGGLCGGSSLLRLAEKNGKWHVAETRPLWAG